MECNRVVIVRLIHDRWTTSSEKLKLVLCVTVMERTSWVRRATGKIVGGESAAEGWHICHGDIQIKHGGRRCSFVLPHDPIRDAEVLLHAHCWCTPALGLQPASVDSNIQKQTSGRGRRHFVCLWLTARRNRPELGTGNWELENRAWQASREPPSAFLPRTLVARPIMKF